MFGWKNSGGKKIKFCQKPGFRRNRWVFNSVLEFIQYQIDMVNKKEIVAQPFRILYKVLNLFAKWLIYTVHWKKITLGIPKGKAMPMTEFQLIWKFHDYWAIPIDESKPWHTQ